MTKFAICLNELTLGLEQKLPPTDSRLRPDQHALEEGVYDKVPHHHHLHHCQHHLFFLICPILMLLVYRLVAIMCISTLIASEIVSKPLWQSISSSATKLGVLALCIDQTSQQTLRL